MSINPLPAIITANKAKPTNYQNTLNIFIYLLQKAPDPTEKNSQKPFACSGNIQHINKTPPNTAVNNLHLYIYDLSYITAI